jgi:hypothetical protein
MVAVIGSIRDVLKIKMYAANIRTFFKAATLRELIL